MIQDGWMNRMERPEVGGQMSEVREKTDRSDFHKYSIFNSQYSIPASPGQGFYGD